MPLSSPSSSSGQRRLPTSTDVYPLALESLFLCSSDRRSQGVELSTIHEFSHLPWTSHHQLDQEHHWRSSGTIRSQVGETLFVSKLTGCSVLLIHVRRYRNKRATV